MRPTSEESPDTIDPFERLIGAAGPKKGPPPLIFVERSVKGAGPVARFYLAPSAASKNLTASSIAALCVAARGASVGQTGIVAFPADVHSARKS